MILRCLCSLFLSAAVFFCLTASSGCVHTQESDFKQTQESCARDEKKVVDWLNQVMFHADDPKFVPEAFRHPDLEAWFRQGRRIPDLEVILQRLFQRRDERCDLAQVAYALGWFTTRRSVPVLLEAIEDDDAQVRKEVIAALGLLGDEESVNALCKRALSDEDANVRFNACISLGKIGDKGAVESLIKALEDKEKSVRLEAVEALGKIGDEKATPHLETIWKEEKDETARIYAACALYRISGREDAFEFIIGALKSGNRADSNPAAAARALGDIGDRRAVKPLVEALKHKVWSVRRNAAISLGKIGDSRAVEPLTDALRDEKWDVRYEAAVALGKIGDKRAVGQLVKALRDECWSVRRESAEALGEIGDNKAVKPLLEALKDRSKYVRRAAARALGVIGNERAVEPLLEALKDGDEFVRIDAAEALKSITKQDFGQEREKWKQWLESQKGKR